MKTNEKDTKQGVIPALRFPEFNNHFWHIKELCKIATLINERARNGNYTPMSVTSGVGLVPQKEKFGRDISGNQYSSYFVIRRGDFAYNKSATNLYPEGYISMLKNLGIAAVPNSIFTCFSVNREEILPEYLNYLFEDNYHGKWLRKFIEVGARTHGSLSIDTKKLFELPIVFPSINEQQKIAECLSSIDALIKVTENKIDELKAHKKGLMQRLFPTEGKTVPALRFPEFQNTGEWTIMTLNKLASRIIKKNNGHICKVLTNSAADGVVDQAEYFSRNIVSENNLNNYYVIENGDYVYNPRVSTSAPVGPISKNYIGKGIMSPLYTIFRFHDTENEFFNQFFKTKYWHKYLKNVANQGARFDRMNITADDFMNMPVPAPCPNEQHKIADCLSSVDDLIMAQTKRLEALKTHKKGLMQQLFPNIDEC